VNRAQRIVLVVAMGIGLFALAGAANLLLLDRPDPGWFTYSPSVGVTMSETDTYFVTASDRDVVEQAAVWLAALAGWTGASVWLLRSSGPTDA
jgi:hypothetical protein